MSSARWYTEPIMWSCDQMCHHGNNLWVIINYKHTWITESIVLLSIILANATVCEVPGRAGSFPPCWVNSVSYLGLLSPSILPCHLHLQQSPAPPLTNITVLDVSPVPWQRQMPLSSTQAHNCAPPSVFRLSLEPHQQLYLGAHQNSVLAPYAFLTGRDGWQEGFAVTEATKEPRGGDRQSIRFF